MSNWKIIPTLMLASALALGQNSTNAAVPPILAATTTLPIVFTNTISADRSHVGDLVTAATTQPVQLANGTVLASGAKIIGHVLAADAFLYDKTPYAQQKPSTLTIQFDTLQTPGASLPLHVTIRAIADPVTSYQARTPMASDVDPQGTVTQIGGDQLTPSQREVISPDGDVVAYNRHGNVYAHLIASGHCDGNNVEVSLGIYSASACGLYGFAQVTATELGTLATPSVLTLVSTHASPKIWKNSTALLEVLREQKQLAAR